MPRNQLCCGRSGQVPITDKQREARQIRICRHLESLSLQSAEAFLAASNPTWVPSNLSQMINTTGELVFEGVAAHKVHTCSGRALNLVPLLVEVT